MHSNGFHSSSPISEKCREDKETLVNMDGKSDTENERKLELEIKR